MPQLATKYFGTLSCSQENFYNFPEGLPGFEQETSFILINLPERHPLVFLQSTTDTQLCFLALPVHAVDTEYELAVSFEDLRNLDLERGRQPRIGDEVLVLALLSVQENQPPSANLMAPIVINLATRRCVQAIRCDFAYSHRYALAAAGGCPC